MGGAGGRGGGASGGGSAGKPRRPFKDFLQEFHLRQCGLKSIAAKNVSALCTAVARHAGQSLDLQLFGVMTGVLEPQEIVLSQSNDSPL